MQTVYRPICQTRPKKAGDGTIIDLEAYRRRVGAGRWGEARQWEPPEEPSPPRYSRKERRWGLFWDAVASLGVVVMVLTFCVELLL